MGTKKSGAFGETPERWPYVGRFVVACGTL